MNSISTFVNVITACESAGGAGTKEAIKTALSTLDAGGRTLVKYAMDPFLVFGVKKFDNPHFYAVVDSLSVEDITSVLDKLAARHLTGNAARDAVTYMLSHLTENSAKYIARVIGKDLQAGFSAETYNKIWKNDKVRVFDVMLADKCETEEDFAAITFPCIGDTKYDGERNVCFQLLQETNFAPGGSSYRSRSGKVAAHMNGLFDEELSRIRDYLGYDFVLDGERMASNYTETINAKKAGSDGEAGKKNMKFRAFFIMPLTDWVNQSCSITMEENRNNLEKILRECNCQKITLSDAIIINDYAHMMEYLDVVTAPGFDGMPNGQEGLILKKLKAIYSWSRELDWCKVKKFFDADARIVGWEYGRNRLSNVMGCVQCVGFLENGDRFEVSVGSGWTDEQRKDVAENFDTKWKDATITLRYQEVSKSKSKQFCSLRFPTFERGPRDDKFIEI